MDPYRHKEWRHFREELIKLEGGRCVRCSRSREDGVVLQVHHKIYVSGRLPWEYSYEECETLCKGCHAEEHGLIMPRSGWISLGGDDLGEFPADTCELCGTELRHIFLIQHLNWGTMSVGTDCHDKLTGTTDAREFHDRSEKLSQKRKRFVSSPRWEKLRSGELAIEQQGIWLRVAPHGAGYRVLMDAAVGKTEYNTVLDAKIKAFELIETGEAAVALAPFGSKTHHLRIRSDISRQAGGRVFTNGLLLREPRLFRHVSATRYQCLLHRAQPQILRAAGANCLRASYVPDARLARS